MNIEHLGRIMSCVRPTAENEFINLIYNELGLTRSVMISMVESLRAEKVIDSRPVDVAINIASRVWDVPVSVMMSKSRVRKNVDARRCVIMILKELGLGCSAAGLVMGCDHATIIHAIKSHEQLFDTDPTYRENYSIVNQMFFEHTTKRRDVKVTDRLKFDLA